MGLGITKSGGFVGQITDNNITCVLVAVVMGRVGGRLVTGSVRMGWCYICVCCESGLSVLGGFLRILGAPSVQSCCTQCSILLHHIDICMLTGICLWQISQIQTCLGMVIGPGLVSTSPAFMRSISSHPTGPHGNRGRLNFHRVCQTAVTAPPRVGCVVWSH